MSKISQNLFITSIHDKTAEYDNPWYKRYAVPLTLAGAGAASFLGAKLFNRLAYRNWDKYLSIGHNTALSDEVRKAAKEATSRWGRRRWRTTMWGNDASTALGASALGFGAYQGYKDITDQ